jgi:hypothetical protein
MGGVGMSRVWNAAGKMSNPECEGRRGLSWLPVAPDLPELIGEAQRALGRKKRLREKFYADITQEHKWEFIQGEVIMHSPALNRHLLASQRLYDLLSAYVRVHQIGAVRHEKAMTNFPRNDYEPDVMISARRKPRSLILTR